MQTNTAHANSASGPYHYYRCKRATAYGPGACSKKAIRVEKVEPLVWEFISGMLKDPERIRRGAEALIRRERDGAHTDPAREAETWEAKLAECARLRMAYQEQQAAGLMTLDELRSRLEELDETRRVAETELAALHRSRERTKKLKEDLEIVLASLSEAIPEALDALSCEERNRLYRMLRLGVTPTADGYDAMGYFELRDPHLRVEKVRQHVEVGPVQNTPPRGHRPLRPPY
jgi:hypothetical protein